MKTLEETKDTIAVKHGYKNWKDVSTYAKSLLVDEVTTEYAIQMCDEQIKACVNNELVKSFCELEFDSDKLKFIKEYLKKTPNVVTTK